VFRFSDIDQGLLCVERLESELLSLTNAGLEAGAGTLLDLFAIAAAKRAMSISVGFRAMICARNMACAAPLIRVHLDTAIRIYAFSLVEDPHELVERVYAGRQIRELRDRNGKNMSDRYLVKQIVHENPDLDWVPRVYDKTSGYVHFSKTHLISLFGPVKPNQKRVTLSYGAGDASFPDEVFVESIEAMAASDQLLIDLHRGWKIAMTGEQFPGLGED